MKWLGKFAIVLVALGIGTALSAQELTGTLKKAKDTGAFTLGYRESSIPFSYLDDKQQPIGYAMDLCMKVFEAVKTELKMPNLKLNLQSVSSSNRIPLLQNGTIDLECGSTTNSVDRQKQVSFGPTYFVINVSAAVKKSSGIKSMADLAGKTISTTSGTTAVPLLRQYEKTKNADIKEIYGKDHAESFLLLSPGSRVGVRHGRHPARRADRQSSNPGDYMILPESLRTEPYSMMLRKDDPQFKALVDKTIDGVMKSGEINKIYAKWFTSPIPPKGVNLNFPETPAIKDAFAHPNDKGV